MSDEFGPAVLSRAVRTGIAPFADDPRRACKGADAGLFFAEKRGPEQNAAKAICRRCIFRSDCLEWALTAPENHGIWGGTTRKERQAILSRQRKEAV